MTKMPKELARCTRDYLERHPLVSEVDAKRPDSQKVHLSVYEFRGACTVGIEFDRTTILNIWLPSEALTETTPARMKVTEKFWKDGKWNGKDGKGANSNLSAYEGFLGRDLVRLGVQSKADAKWVFDQLLV